MGYVLKGENNRVSHLAGWLDCHHLVADVIAAVPFQHNNSLLDIANSLQAVGGRVPGKENGTDCTQPSCKFLN